MLFLAGSLDYYYAAVFALLVMLFALFCMLQVASGALEQALHCWGLPLL